MISDILFNEEYIIAAEEYEYQQELKEAIAKAEANKMREFYYIIVRSLMNHNFTKEEALKLVGIDREIYDTFIKGLL
ncbi:MAG: hypothetical protein IJ737_02530 [Ruminococcus sp.]|nr:hypothetical protein [Ruminococcus sp.]